MVLILAENGDWSLLWISDLKHWIRMRSNSFLAGMTKVIIWSDRALVSDSSKGILIASIADDALVFNLFLLLLLHFKMVGKQLLVLRSAVFADFFGEDLLEIFEELVVELSGTVALLAWEASLVDGGTIAFEALWGGIIINSFLINCSVDVIWFDDEAADLLLVSNDIFLASLRFSLDLGVAGGILGLGLGLRGTLVSSNDGAN